MRKVLLTLLAIVLVGCKPPKFNQAIVCNGGFSATDVSVYSYDSRRVVVIHPDKSYEILLDDSCIISGGSK